MRDPTVEAALQKHRGRRTQEDAAPTFKPNGPAPPSPLTAAELSQLKFEPIKYVVPGIIVEGLTLLAAKPKIGKSWMMLHAAIAVACGGYTLGKIHCPEGDVRYFALEDNLRRLQSRMTKLLGISQQWPERLSFQTEMPRLAEGGIDSIRDWIEGAERPRLAVIDTLAMIRPPKGKDQTQYDADYQAVKQLRELANQRCIAIVLVHHLRKQSSDDPFDLVSGTLGLTGSVDTVLVLRRDGKGNNVLHGRGRDLSEIEKAMIFSKTACTWTIQGDFDEVRQSNERAAVLAAMNQLGKPASPKEIAAIADMKANNVTKLLTRMVQQQTVHKLHYGKYEIASKENRQEEPAMRTACEKCGKAVANLNTGKNLDGRPGPGSWLCAACLTEERNTADAWADEDAAERGEPDGRLNGSTPRPIPT
jgi:hypothetical protein